MEQKGIGDTVHGMRFRLEASALLAIIAIGSSALVGCSSDSKQSQSTNAEVETTTEVDEPATTNAPAVPADVADGNATITVTIGTDDFDTTGGTRVVSVPKGTNVTLELTDPSTDQEYHLHGYELEVSANKGETAKLSFTANQTGQFDLESHTTEGTLLVLVVV